MNLSWASDFSYGYFRKILQTVNSNFKICLLSQAPYIVEGLNKSKLILRHDVDVSLKRALIMARIEKDFGIRATYMVMTESLLYCIEDDTSHDILQKMIDMGHEIGLHIDPCSFETDSIEAKINSACKRLKKIIGRRVLAVSFHQPPEKYQRGHLTIGNRVNAYAERLMEWYLSDSSGCWKYGEPLPKLSRPDKSLLQMLIHPIWWGDEHMSREERLRAFVLEETRGKPPDCAKILRSDIIKTIGVKFDL